ncbi:MAG: hypothetical protein JKY37_04405, partial [Nannocystaceae bacterium]|nr:hypothetical protein [Nannocystaceae bacterium]
MSDQSPQGDRLLLVAFGLSGCAALGYEVLWTRLLSLGLGSETLGVLGVLAGFFAGMALGAWVLHDRVRRSPDPLALFVRLELIAAAFAVASPWMLHGLMDTLAATGDSVSGPGVVRAILIGGALLLPGSFCLGATFAALAEDQRRRNASEPSGRGLARLYAANTIGATAGVLLTVHVVLPAVGMGMGAAVLAACGVMAVMVAR